jgi:two-component system LytT family response regulator
MSMTVSQFFPPKAAAGAARVAPAETRRGAITALLMAGDPGVRGNLRAILGQDPEISVVGEFADGLEAIDSIAGLQPQLVILDAGMPGVNGFQVVERVGREGLPAVVLFSSCEEQALRAFELGATDFILVSDGPGRVRMALERAKGEIRRREPNPPAVAHPQADGPGADPGGTAVPHGDKGPWGRVLLKTSGEYIFLRPDEIRWIEADGDYMKFHVKGRHYMLRETMARLEARLDSRRFVRIHRSVIVNIDSVAKLSPTFAGEYAVWLDDGTRLRMSRRYDRRLMGLAKTAI